MCWMKHASDVASGSSKAVRAQAATLEHTASCSPVALNRVCVWVCTPRLSQSLIASSTLSRGPTGLKYKPPPAWNLAIPHGSSPRPSEKCALMRLWASRWGR